MNPTQSMDEGTSLRECDLIPVGQGSQASFDTAFSDGAPGGPLCFRLSGIPSHWCITDIRRALESLDTELNFLQAKISTLSPAYFGKYQTALLTLAQPSAYFQFSDPNEEKHHVIPDAGDGTTVRLVIDKHFHGLTPLNVPRHPITADVIAITGLGGHAFGSWRSRSTAAADPLHRPMWLRDFLPERFPHARIMTYGYDSSLVKPNHSLLIDYRRELINSISRARLNCPKRPVILVGHSLGGILIVQLLIELSQITEPNNLRDSIWGIFFFGTPHQGLSAVGLREMAAKRPGSGAVLDLLKQLEEGSEFLENQKEALNEICKDKSIKIFTFYETEKSHSVKEVEPGVWSREGGAVQMVQRLSAQLYLPNESRYPILSNHTDMVKFNSPQDRAYQTVVTCMEFCLDYVDRDKVVALIEVPARPEELLFYIDQDRHLQECGMSGDGSIPADIFFIYNNIDYKAWCARNSHIQALIYRGFVSLGRKSPYHNKFLNDMGDDVLSLKFFYEYSARSIKEKHSCQNRDTKYTLVSMVWTFLYQIIETHEEHEKDVLLRMFLKVLVFCLDDTTILGLRSCSGPKHAFDYIQQFSSLKDLWAALEEVLIKATEFISKKREGGPRYEQRDKRSLNFILDLYSFPTEDWSELMSQFRHIQHHLRADYVTVKLLITNPPEVGDLGLLDRSEVLVQYDRERQECLSTLHFKNSRYDKIVPHYNHTFEWLWATPEYKSWSLSESSSNLILIEGKPGSGKSTLVRYFKDNFHPTCPGDVVCSFFYNARDGQLERDHRNMLKGLLYQLLLSDETFFVYFQNIYRQGSGKDIEWSPDVLKGIMLACKDHSRVTKVYLIIDAMDESACTDRTDIVLFLRALSFRGDADAACEFRVFLASRPINELQTIFWPHRHRILLQEMNRKDIETFTRGFLLNAIFDSLESIKQQLQDYIVSNSEGVFLWVRLVAKELEKYALKGSRPSTMLEYLTGLPKDLESFYERMLGGIGIDDHDDIVDAQRILQFCLFSHRAVELEELQQALAIPGQLHDCEPDPRKWWMNLPSTIRRLVIHTTGGFVQIKERKNVEPVVQTMHQTVREFFLDSSRTHVRQSRIGAIFSTNSAAMIQLTCIRFLEIFYLEATSLLIVDLPGPPRPVDLLYLPHIRYLNTRTFIKYSLEHLKENCELRTPEISDRLSNLMKYVHSTPNSRTSLATVLLKSFLSSKLNDTEQTRIDQLLLLAVKAGYPVATQILLVSNADSLISRHGRTLLRIAASMGHYAIAQNLLDSHQVLPGAGDDGGRDLLHLAALKGHKDIVQLLLDRGADIETQDSQGSSSLHLAALEGHADIVQLLLDRGAYIETQDREGSSPLHLTALEGHADIVQLLLDRGAYIETQDRQGRSPLHLATLKGHADIVQLLLDRGANIRGKSKIGATSLHLAIWEGKNSIIRLLLNDKVGLEERGNELHTALHLAVELEKGGIIRYLLESGIDTTICVKDYGRTPVRFVSIEGMIVTCKVFIAGLGQQTTPHRSKRHCSGIPRMSRSRSRTQPLDFYSEPPPETCVKYYDTEKSSPLLPQGKLEIFSLKLSHLSQLMQYRSLNSKEVTTKLDYSGPSFKVNIDAEHNSLMGSVIGAEMGLATACSGMEMDVETACSWTTEILLLSRNC